MAQSMNTKVDFTTPASSFRGLGTTGKVMVGDHAYEYYNDKNVEDYIQIPWDQVDYISAEVLFNKWIPRFAIFTKENGHFDFSAPDNKALLRAIREYVPESRMFRSPSFFKVFGSGLKHLITRK